MTFIQFLVNKGARGVVPGVRLGSLSAPATNKETTSSASTTAAAAGGGVSAVLNIARRAGGPSTQKRGTVTRRTQSGLPTRRLGANEPPLPSNQISVSGIGGIRNIKGNKNKY
jgi:hypothetical protein